MTAVRPARELAVELWRLFDAGRFRDALPLLAEDFEARWPNTRERIRGPENFIALNENYPGRLALYGPANRGMRRRRGDGDRNQ